MEQALTQLDVKILFDDSNFNFSVSQLHKLVRHGLKHFAKHTERL